MRLSVLWVVFLLVSCGSVPQPPALPPVVRVVSHKHTIESDIRSRYSITGELVNESAAPVYNTLVQARYYDGLDRPLAEMSTKATLQLMLPGQRSPFFITLSADTPLLQAVERYDLFVVSSVTPLQSIDVVPLKVANHRLQVTSTQPSGALEIAGEVTNTSGESITSVVIVGTIYDQQGQIFKYRHSTVLGSADALQDGLGIGETAQFAFSSGLQPEGSSAGLPSGYTYTVQAEGYK